VLASQRAAECGVEEAILVRDGVITEGSHTSFCAVFDGQVVTSPLSNYILPGITRQVVIDLCGELGIAVVQFPIAEARLRDAEEMMLLGTGSEVMPVVQVDDWKVGDGRPGPVTRRLLEAYRKLYA
jgi:D-alanine transaminase